MGFPTQFFKDENIGSYKYTVLMFDKDKKAVGIHFTNDETDKFRAGRFSISKHKGYGASVVAQSFFNTYEISPLRYYGRYEWKKHNIDGVGEVYVIELKEREKENEQFVTGGD